MKKKTAETPETKLVTVHTLTEQITAELIRNMLIEHEIKAEIGGENQGGFSGAMPIEIIVREDKANLAAELIKEFYDSTS